MYCVEIAFKDGKGNLETLMVRRASFTLGGNSAQIAIEDLNSLSYLYKFVRGIGRTFSVRKVNKEGNPIDNEEIRHEDRVVLDSESAVITVIALDIDLVKKENEALDRAGVRILKRALSQPIPKEVSLDIQPLGLVISFAPDEPIQIGRTKNNSVRVDFSDVSSVHAKFGFQDNQFWVEDLGSTNGTFIDGKQISGRVAFNVNQTVVLGREVRIKGLLSKSQAVVPKPIEPAVQAEIASEPIPVTEEKQEGRERRLSLVKPIAAYKAEQNLDAEPEQLSETISKMPEQIESYPAIVTLSPVARPARVVLRGTKVVKIGRDPSCEMWIGAPHVSRLHCSFQGRGDDEVIASDSSTNGTSYGKGILKKGDSLEIKVDPLIFDFGGGVTVAVCFNKEQEDQFTLAGGDPQAFAKKLTPSAEMSRDQVDGLKRLSEQLAGKFRQQPPQPELSNTTTRSRPLKSTKPVFTAKLIAIMGAVAIALGVFVAVIGSLLVSLF